MKCYFYFFTKETKIFGFSSFHSLPTFRYLDNLVKRNFSIGSRAKEFSWPKGLVHSGNGRSSWFRTVPLKFSLYSDLILKVGQFCTVG